MCPKIPGKASGVENNQTEVESESKQRYFLPKYTFAIFLIDKYD